MKPVFTFLFLVMTFVGFAQNLKPTIGLSSLPANNESVCAIPVYTGNFNASGLQAGDTIPGFRFYDRNGVSYDAQSLLQSGKPLLVIGGSYTCPVFRQKIARINQIATQFSGQLNILVVYVVEAHPKSPDVSPYSGNVWTTSDNQSEGVLYLQPTTYGARKQTLSDMLAKAAYTLSVPVVIDGPCNQWWSTFGPAPNNAYLIKPNGVIYKKHGWFDKNPDNMVSDITALLAQLPPPLPEFTFQLQADTISIGRPGGDDVVVTGSLINTHSTAIEVDIIRKENNLPSGWFSYMCADICASPTQDSMRVYLPGNFTQLFKLSFSTAQLPTEGNTLICFKNKDNFSNQLTVRLWGRTDVYSGLAELDKKVRIWPTLIREKIYVEGVSTGNYYVSDLAGRTLLSGLLSEKTELNLNSLSTGTYLLSIDTSFGSIRKRIIKE